MLLFCCAAERHDTSGATVAIVTVLPLLLQPLLLLPGALAVALGAFTFVAGVGGGVESCLAAVAAAAVVVVIVVVAVVIVVCVPGQARLVQRSSRELKLCRQRPAVLVI